MKDYQLWQKLIEESEWLPASPSQLDIVLYACLLSEVPNSQLRRTLAYSYAQLRRSAGVHYNLSGAGRMKLSGMSTNQLSMLLSKAVVFATSARTKQKRADYRVIADYVRTLLKDRVVVTNAGIPQVTSKLTN